MLTRLLHPSSEKGPFVFQVDDEHAKKVSINILGSAADVSVIDGDIDPEKKMVMVGNYQIADGDALRTEEAVAPPNGRPPAPPGSPKQ